MLAEPLLDNSFGNEQRFLQFEIMLRLHWFLRLF